MVQNEVSCQGIYNIAIPSHKRLDVLKRCTLSFLDRHDIPHSKIYIFVAEEELNDYIILETKGYNVCIGDKGIHKQREAISNYFDEDEYLVSIDDDVNDMIVYDVPIDDLDFFILYSIASMKDRGLTLCGVYPSSNTFFFRRNESDDLRFCIGQFKIFLNKRFLERRKYQLLEDYENTIKHYDYAGGVLRYNYIGLKANYKTLKGGLYEYRSDIKKKNEVIAFNKQYPNYTRIKKGGYDVFLKKNGLRDTLTTLWIGDELNELAEVSLLSWIKQGYNIDLYVDINGEFKLPQSLLYYAEGLVVPTKAPVINLLDANRIMDTSQATDISSVAVDEVLPFSDIWRYKMIYKTGATWVDADMFLIDKLPNDEIIISSENTMQSGCFKSFSTIVPNIGVLRFPKENETLKKIIDKIDKKKTTSKFCDNMKIFRKEIVKTEYKISHPKDYCPVDWWNYQSLYHSDIYKTKFNVKPLTNKEIMETSIGIHLWNNFSYGGAKRTKIDFNQIHQYSLYNLLHRRL